MGMWVGPDLKALAFTPTMPLKRKAMSTGKGILKAVRPLKVSTPGPATPRNTRSSEPEPEIEEDDDKLNEGIQRNADHLNPFDNVGRRFSS